MKIFLNILIGKVGLFEKIIVKNVASLLPDDAVRSLVVYLCKTCPSFVVHCLYCGNVENSITCR